MSRTRTYFKALLRGNNTYSTYTGFFPTIFLIIPLLLLYGIFFLVSGSNLLAFLSFIFVLLTILILIITRKGMFILAYLMVYCEVLLYILCTSYFLTEDYGISLHAITLIPFSYFVSYSLKKNRKFLLHPGVLSIISLLVFILSKILLYFTPIAQPLNEKPNLAMFSYFINATFTLIVIIAVCKIFTNESAHRQQSLEEKNSKLDLYANQDLLTSLPNRRYMKSFLEQTIQKVNIVPFHFSILMCDIDNFKQINDTYGHHKGDLVLKNFSSIIKNNIREFDCACRWGGEEFVILVRGGAPIANLIANRVLDEVSKNTVDVGDQEITYSVTIGVSEFHSGWSSEEVLDKADENLYKGKRMGKNRIICE